MIITNLLNKGYNGKILLNAPFEFEFIKAAANYASRTIYNSRFFYTLDELGAETGIRLLKSVSRNVIYSTRFTTSCSSTEYYKEISIASSYLEKKAVSSVFAFTIDNMSSFKKAYNSGARGILTNDPLSLFNWAKRNGINLAGINDGTLKPSQLVH